MLLSLLPNENEMNELKGKTKEESKKKEGRKGSQEKSGYRKKEYQGIFLSILSHYNVRVYLVVEVVLYSLSSMHSLSLSLLVSGFFRQLYILARITGMQFRLTHRNTHLRFFLAVALEKKRKAWKPVCKVDPAAADFLKFPLPFDSSRFLQQLPKVVVVFFSG